MRCGLLVFTLCVVLAQVVSCATHSESHAHPFDVLNLESQYPVRFTYVVDNTISEPSIVFSYESGKNVAIHTDNAGSLSLQVSAQSQSDSNSNNSNSDSHSNNSNSKSSSSNANILRFDSVPMISLWFALACFMTKWNRYFLLTAAVILCLSVTMAATEEEFVITVEFRVPSNTVFRKISITTTYQGNQESNFFGQDLLNADEVIIDFCNVESSTVEYSGANTKVNICAAIINAYLTNDIKNARIESNTASNQAVNVMIEPGWEGEYQIQADQWEVSNSACEQQTDNGEVHGQCGDANDNVIFISGQAAMLTFSDVNSASATPSQSQPRTPASTPTTIVIASDSSTRSVSAASTRSAAGTTTGTFTAASTRSAAATTFNATTISAASTRSAAETTAASLSAASTRSAASTVNASAASTRSAAGTTTSTLSTASTRSAAGTTTSTVSTASTRSAAGTTNSTLSSASTRSAASTVNASISAVSTRSAAGTTTSTLSSASTRSAAGTVNGSVSAASTRSAAATTTGSLSAASTRSAAATVNGTVSAASTRSAASTVDASVSAASTRSAAGTTTSTLSTASTRSAAGTTNSTRSAAGTTTSTLSAASTRSAAGTTTGTISAASTVNASPSSASTRSAVGTTTSTVSTASTRSAAQTTTGTLSAASTRSAASTINGTTTASVAASSTTSRSAPGTTTGTVSAASTRSAAGTTTGSISAASTRSAASTINSTTTASVVASSTSSGSAASTRTAAGTTTRSAASTPTGAGTTTRSAASTPTAASTTTRSAASTPTAAGTTTASASVAASTTSTRSAPGTTTRSAASTPTGAGTTTRSAASTPTAAGTTTRSAASTPTAASTTTRSAASTPTAAGTTTRSAASTPTAAGTTTRSAASTPTAASTTTRSAASTPTAASTTTRSAASTPTAASTTTRSVSVSASKTPVSGVIQPCQPGWTEPAAVDVVPATSPVSPSWNNPGATYTLNNSTNWGTNSYGNKLNITQFDVNTVQVHDHQYDGAGFWIYTNDMVLPNIATDTLYTFSFDFYQSINNSYTDQAPDPDVTYNSARGNLNSTAAALTFNLFVVNNIDEVGLWKWIGYLMPNKTCNGNNNDKCKVFFGEPMVPNVPAPFTEATALRKSIQFQVNASDTMQLVMYVALPGRPFTPAANNYFFKNFQLVKSPRARSFGTPLARSSEIVDVPIAPLQTVPTPQTNCPHLRSGLKNWHDASTWAPGQIPRADGSDFTLPANTSVLISSCSLSNGTYGLITIPEGSELIFGDANINMNVENIKVAGHLWIGSPTCRIRSYVTITLMDSAANVGSDGRKGIVTTNTGMIDMHGKLYQRTWSRLAASAQIGDDRVLLQNSVNWEVGQQVVITTSIWQDHITNQNEVMTIANIQGDKVQFTQPFKFFHYAGKEYQSEVALLSRRIVIQGDQASESSEIGGHMLARGPYARFSGVQAYRMGQRNVIARYPFHFHMMGESPLSFFQDCSVYKSYFRCFTVHGTNSTRLSNNVAHNILGHCFYLEDGVEEKNTYEFNLASLMYPLVEVDLTQQYGQDAPPIYEQPGLHIPADAAPGGYYISNANNYFTGNVASGGFAGFSFINFPKPIGNHRQSTIIPQERPLGKFYGNTAHSSSYQWPSAACVYVGGNQVYVTRNGQEILEYSVGRFSRNTKADNGTVVWMTFEHTRVYMCNRGLNHWGERVEAVNYEAHDITKGITMFGEAWLDSALLEGRSKNPSITTFPSQRLFEYYDTYVKTILTNITMKSLVQEPTKPTSSGSYGIVSMTHSDKFKPQGINAAKNIVYDNVWVGGEVGNTIRTTGASRYYNIIDWDGSILNYPFGNGNPVIIGSANSETPYLSQQGVNISTTVRDWWKIGSDSNCLSYPQYVLYACPKRADLEIAYIQFDIHMLTNNVTSWPSQWAELPSGLNVGRVSQFGYTGNNRRSTIVTKNPGVTGITGDSGWYFNFDLGTPEQFYIRCMQIPNVDGNKKWMYVALKFPNAATLNITTNHLWKTKFKTPVTKVSTMAQVIANTNGTSYYEKPATTAGEKWVILKLVDRHFDDERVANGFFERKGVRLYDVMVFYWYEFTVQSCPGCQSTTPVPGSSMKYFTVTDEVPPFLGNL